MRQVKKEGDSLKYKVVFEKWEYVEADNEEDALEKASEGDTVYGEEEPVEAVLIDEFIVDW